MAFNFAGLIGEMEYLTQGEWLMSPCGNGRIDFHTFQALVANLAWCIWKSRCDLVFKVRRQQPNQIFQFALNHTYQHLNRTGNHLREYLTNSVFNSSITIFCDASWCPDQRLCGTGFIVVKGTRCVILAGASCSQAESSLQAELLAAGAAVELCERWNLKPDKLYTDCPEVLTMLDRPNNEVTWRFHNDNRRVRDTFRRYPQLELLYCPIELNAIADLLAGYGRRNPQLSLFHQGVDKPRWLEKALNKLGLQF